MIKQAKELKARILIDREVAEAAVHGGAILGGGGGGWIEEGQRLAAFALKKGFTGIWPLESLNPDDLVLTVSVVGAPSAGKKGLRPEDYSRAVEYFLERTKPKVLGLISSEVGATAVVNGWVQSIQLGILSLDAAANGRAHPLGLMGSMGLHRQKRFFSQQAAVGRDSSGRRVEEFFQGSIEETSAAVRKMAANSGGMVAVARNPVPAAYVKKYGAPGAISMAIRVGQIYRQKKNLPPAQLMEAILRQFGDGVVYQGKVEKFALRQSGGFDVGQIQIKGPEGWYELVFLNEYMTLERNGRRLATFPDLIMTFEANSGRPLISAALKRDLEVFILTSPKNNLVLGAGVKDRSLLRRVEAILGKKII